MSSLSGLLRRVKSRVARACPAPAIRTNPAALTVRCYSNWGDLDDAIRFLTPGGHGRWGEVAFVTHKRTVPDWTGFFNHAGRKPVRIEASPNRVFFAIGEPPTPEHREMHLGQGGGTFVLTSDEELVRTQPAPRHFIAAPCMTRTWHVRRSFDELQKCDPGEKTASLSWITSNKSWMAGHRVRLNFLDQLRRRVDFDLYGRGFKPVADKWDALAPYRYSIAFENAQAPFYFTEKLMDCFLARTMPIYFGSPAIGEFFPAESMIVIDPDEPDVFAKIADAARSDLWRQRRDAIEEARRLVLDRYNIFARIAKFMTESSASQAPLPPQRLEVTPVKIPMDG
jgi:hypothetical protein